MTAASDTGSQRNSPAPLQLWYAYPADLANAAVEEACIALLNDAERARAARFRFDRHRREYLAAHVLTRTALSFAHPVPPRQWSFSVNKYGKPAPIPGSPRTGPRQWGGIPECGFGFNQSHSVELVACLIARGAANIALSESSANAKVSPEAGAEVGIDVEAHSRAEKIVPLAPNVFSPAEQSQLNALPAAERPHRALSLWTLKEAYIKARGMGLSLPLQGISFLFGGAEGIRLETGAEGDSNPSRWRFCLLDQSRHRVAMVVDRQILSQTFLDQTIPNQASFDSTLHSASENQAAPFRPLVQIFEARPPYAAPTPLPSGSETWFPRLTVARKAG